MTWQAYRVVFRLLAPMHIGYRKVGNIQLTRPYVTGRVLWGALTARLTRDIVSTPRGEDYIEKGKQVNERLAFTYFYPAVEEDGDYQLYLPPFDDEFYYRFLFTYASTALEYDRFAAEEGSLHEVEYIGPYTRDEGAPVYLAGYVIAKDSGLFGWQRALERVQLGGERGYGWGRVRVELMEGLQGDAIHIFDCYEVDLKADPLIITVAENTPLLAHTEAEGVSAAGPIEPLVGREWENLPNPEGRVGAGQHLSRAKICYAPGSKVSNKASFIIGPYGIWHKIRTI